MPSDAHIISQGKDAWRRIKKSRTLEDWQAIGAALIVGRKLCMKEAAIDIPHGRNYSHIHKAWLEKTGFAEIHRAMRVGAALLAENGRDVQTWWQSLPPERREATNAQHIWRCFSAAMTKKSPYSRRLRIDEATALQVQEDIRLALRDVARRKLYTISENMIRDFAQAACTACLNALDIAVPATNVRRVTVSHNKATNGTGMPATA